MKQYLKRAWAEISLSGLQSNISLIKKLAGASTNIMAVVKADAYGHGEGEICHCLEKSGVKYFAVSNLDEALQVRGFCPSGEILILGYTPPEYAEQLAENNIIQGVISREYALELVKNHKNVRCHIKIDTGMGRIGLKYDTPQECAEEIKNIISIDGLSVEGIYTHFAVADSDEANNIKYTDNQEKFILDTYDILESQNIHLEHVHFMNSAALCYRANPRSTLARAGIIMYGLTNNNLNLKSTFSLVSEIIEIKKIKKGEVVSDDGNYKALCDETIGIVSIGYADGVNRKLTGSYVYINNKKYKIIGNICMDMMMVLIDDSVSISDTV